MKKKMVFFPYSDSEQAKSLSSLIQGSHQRSLELLTGRVLWQTQLVEAAGG